MELTKETVALLAACGVLIGTIISNLMTYLIHRSKERNEWRKESKKKKMEKGEELYKNLVIWKRSVFVTHNDWVLLVRGHLTLDTINERINQRHLDNPEFGKISEVTTILAGIYFPDIFPSISEAQKKLKPANDIYFSLVSGKGIKNKQDAVSAILDCGRNFDKHVDEILKSISNKIIGIMDK